MEFYLLEDLDFHLVVFHPYRALLHICGREPADTGKFAKTRVEEDAEIRKRETDSRKKREVEAKAKGASAAVFGDGDEETEEERVGRLMGRGTGEGLMDVEEGVFQICL